jgi:hypothetical protein
MVSLKLNKWKGRDMKLRFALIVITLNLMASLAWAANSAGRGGVMPAIYDGQLFTINFFELEGSAESLIAHNTSINVIYTSEDLLPGGEMFVAVLDAIQGDGFNPLWVEAEIEFTPGHTPRQLMSDDEIEAAVASGEIIVTFTDEVYRCSVIGPKK